MRGLPWAILAALTLGTKPLRPPIHLRQISKELSHPTRLKWESAVDRIISQYDEILGKAGRGDTWEDLITAPEATPSSIQGLKNEFALFHGDVEDLVSAKWDVAMNPYSLMRNERLLRLLEKLEDYLMAALRADLGEGRQTQTSDMAFDLEIGQQKLGALISQQERACESLEVWYERSAPKPSY